MASINKLNNTFILLNKARKEEVGVLTFLREETLFYQSTIPVSLLEKIGNVSLLTIRLSTK